MSADPFSRTRLLLGDEGMARLAAARVAVFGLGGVGGYVVEALARSGVGALDLIDSDTVSPTNLNRQILATVDTVGMYKADAAEARVKSINPACAVRKSTAFFLPENAGEFDFAAYDYVADAIDTVTGKIGLILAARAAGTPVISAMGTGNKADPSLLQVSDLCETRVCPLARVMRRELRKRGVPRLKVAWSPEPPLVPRALPDGEPGAHPRRAVPGSTAFVPSAMGLVIAGVVVRTLAGLE